MYAAKIAPNCLQSVPAYVGINFEKIVCRVLVLLAGQY